MYRDEEEIERLREQWDDPTIGTSDGEPDGPGCSRTAMFLVIATMIAVVGLFMWATERLQHHLPIWLQ